VTDLSDLIGVPFVYGGRGKEGFDCWGLTIEVFRRFGIEIPDYQPACAALSESGFSTGNISAVITEKVVRWQRIDEPEAPCLVIFHIDGNAPGMCNHLGVHIGDGKFVHTLFKRNACIERLSHPWFSRRREGFYRYTDHGDSEPL
jgi:cell wall-associated NlpC family hydrolase